MKSLLASVRVGGGFDRVDHAVQLLEDEWRKHGDVPLERLWSDQRRLIGPGPGESIVLLSELIKTDLRCRFARGQTPTVEGYLERFPELEASDSRVLSLIYEEFCLAEERGDRVDVDAFCDRYPRWKDSLVSQLQYHHLFSQAAGVRPAPPPFPEAGDTFEEFQLASLLGRGGTSRVFLARDLSLGGKQVVLKVSLDRGREPQAQGALDHPHIVPVNSVVFGDGGMRGLSMPYRPGRPLDEVIRRVDPASRPRWAKVLWEAVAVAGGGSAAPAESAATSEARTPGPKGDGWEGFPVRGSYAQGVAWVVKVIAEALHYAHGQQTFHRDVKPANVLLTVQHGPQLLDFNLAESPHSAAQAQAAMHGGTLPYMAPEQIEAFLDPALWGKVGAPADIYSLGLVLRELLTGQAPDLPAETLAPARAMRVLLDRRPLLDVTVRRANPAIPHALEAIVAKCLSVSIADRYPDAGALAEDLDRFLHRRPLAYASNPSRRERSTNWAYRNRFPLAVSAMSLSLLLALGMFVERSLRGDGPPPAIEENRELVAAVAALNRGKAGQSIGPLLRLSGIYPGSCLPGIYLALAYKETGNLPLAEDRLSEALAMKDAGRELAHLGLRDPGSIRQIDRFAKALFLGAEKLARTSTDDGPESERILHQRYRLTCRAGSILLPLRVEIEGRAPGGDVDVSEEGGAFFTDQDHPRPYLNEFDIARAAQEVGDYEDVIRRADLAIWKLSDGIATLKDRGDELRFERPIYDWRRLRCRARIKLAERRRAEESPEALDPAVADLDAADKDFQDCKQAAYDMAFPFPELLGLERIRLAWILTRFDIEIGRGRLKEARALAPLARDTFKAFQERVRGQGARDEVKHWKDRLQAIERRLGEAERELGLLR